MILQNKNVLVVCILVLAMPVLANQQSEAMDTSEQVNYAIEDLAVRLGQEASEIKVVNQKSMTWRSGALGCPRPHEQYTQALVPGVLINLQAGDTIYRYHAKENGTPFYCPDKFAESAVINSPEI